MGEGGNHGNLVYDMGERGRRWLRLDAIGRESGHRCHGGEELFLHTVDMTRSVSQREHVDVALPTTRLLKNTAFWAQPGQLRPHRREW